MSIKVILTLLLISSAALAQVPPAAPPPGTAPPPPDANAPAAPSPNTTPPANTAPPPPAAAAPVTVAPPAAAPPAGTPPPAAPAPGGPVPAAPGDPSAPPPVIPPVQLVPVNSGALPSLVTPSADKKDGKEKGKEAKAVSYREIEINSSLRNKSPFMIPTDLYLKIKKRQGERVVESVIDDNVGPKLRWPLRSYYLIGVLTGVKVPKALIADKEGKIHTFRTKELIANSGGYISEIGNGEVIVVERGAEFKLSLKKDSR